MSGKKVTCPFESAHQIFPDRMQTHLIKCGKQYKKRLLEQGSTHLSILKCPFNFVHQFKADEMEALQNHMSRCPNRDSLDQFMHQSMPVYSQPIIPVAAPQQTQLVASQPSTSVDSGENWDDCNAETYDPVKANEGNALFLCPKGQTRSERRAFRHEHCKKYSTISNGEQPREAYSNDYYNENYE